VEHEARITVEPGADLGMLVGAVIVEDRMDDLAGRHLRSTIRARQTCFCGLLRLATTASRRARSAAVALTMIPLRMPQTRTRREPRETLSDSSVRFYPLVSFDSEVRK